MSDVGRALALRIPLSDCWKCLISAVSMRSMQTCVHNDAALTCYTQTLFVFHRWQDETPFALSTGTTFVEQRMSAQYSGTSNMTGFSEIRASLVAVREPKVITLFDSKTTVNYFQFYRSLIILIWRKHKWPRLEKFTKSTEETVTADQMNKNMANLSITCRACIHKRALCYYVDM